MDLFEALACFQSTESVRDFLQELCTPVELNAFESRLKAAKMLSDNVTYREISKATGLSTATVTRVARALKEGNGGYRMALKLLENKNSQEKS